MVWYENVQKYLSLHSLIWRASQLGNLSDNSAFIVLTVNSNSPQQLMVRSMTISMTFFWIVQCD